MCGRYTIIASPEALRALFGYAEQPNFPPRYNVSPTQPIAIVRLTRDQAEWEPVSRPDRAQNKNGARSDAKPGPTFADRAPGKRHFALVRWGLLPSWVKDPKAFTLLINARGESIAEKPAFRAAMKRRRCLIPADGFYEWKPVGGRKQPYYVHAKAGTPLAFAGVWETWTGPNGEEMETAAIVTTTANRTLAPIHNRMPVIVPPEQFELWLDNANVEPASAAALIRPAPDDLLEAYPVATDVNRPANDNPMLVERVAEIAEGSEPPPKPKPRLPNKRDTPKPAKKTNGQGVLF